MILEMLFIVVAASACGTVIGITLATMLNSVFEYLWHRTRARRAARRLAS